MGTLFTIDEWHPHHPTCAPLVDGAGSVFLGLVEENKCSQPNT